MSTKPAKPSRRSIARSSSSHRTTKKNCRTLSCAAASFTTSVFPEAETLAKIVEVHHPGIKPRLLTEALTQFYEIREQPGLKKKPSTSEVLDWLKLLLAEDIDPETLKRDGASALPTLHGALLKNEQDVHLFERLAFMARGGR